MRFQFFDSSGHSLFSEEIQIRENIVEIISSLPRNIFSVLLCLSSIFSSYLLFSNVNVSCSLLPVFNFKVSLLFTLESLSIMENQQDLLDYGLI
jgi:hypothetical protein